MDALSKGVERRIQKSPWYLKLLLKIEAKRMREYEREVFDIFQHKTIISAQDRALILHPHNKEISIIANGVDLDFFAPKNLEKKVDLVFTGNMSYPPNVDSACFLAEQIMPLVWQSMPQTTLMISGVNPAPRVKKLASDKIIVTGWVEDIRNSYAQAKLFIAPMQMGTGLQNKLLEAMAMGIPCITSPLANNALGAEPDQEILIGKTPEEFKQLISNLLNDKDLYTKISTNGHRFAHLNFNWEQKTKELKQLIFPVHVYESESG